MALDVTPERLALLRTVALAVPGHRACSAVLVAVDGVDGAGKSVFCDQLAETLTMLDRPVIRASVDDFHHPRAHRYQRGRQSPSGFWLDSFDYAALRRELLDPLRAGGTGRYRAAVHDVVSDAALDLPAALAPPGAVLVLDGLFLHRDELAGLWDISVWLSVPFEVTAARMAVRDGSSADPDHPGMRRYVLAQRRYFAQCTPWARARFVIDNSVLDTPRITSIR